MSRLGRAVLAVRRVAIVLALLALLLGVGDRDASPPRQAPTLDVLVAVDRTTSMSALDDPAGSRMIAVRRDLAQLASDLQRARFAVMTFGSSATLELPFTSDRVAFGDTVRFLQTERPDAGTGTVLARAVPMMTQQLRVAEDQSPTDESGRDVPVVVFVSDGENTSTADRESFGAVGADADGAVVLGYGTTAGGVMPLRRPDVGDPPPRPPPAGRGPFVPDPATGQPAVSRADPASLRSIAGQLGGSYVAAGGAGGPGTMTAVARLLERAAYADQPATHPERQLRWLWALVLLLLVLPELRRGVHDGTAARREVQA